MAEATTVRTYRSLSELVQEMSEAPDYVAETSLIKRQYPRYPLVARVPVTLLGGSGSGQKTVLLLRDVSAGGIGLTSWFRFDSRQPVLIELCVNDAEWRDKLYVMHCTQTINGYKVGLTLGQDSCPDEPPIVSKRSDRRLRERADLRALREEIRNVMNEYRLARKSWGLFGKPLRNTLLKVIEGLPEPAIEGAADDVRRTEPRLQVDNEVEVVFSTTHGWRRARGWGVGVSPTGLGVLIPPEVGQDLIEQELAGVFKMGAGMPVVVGFGVRPEMVWVPGELAYCDEPTSEYWRVGVEFDTARSRETWGA